VRLDHLLSKEHWPAFVGPGPGLSPFVGHRVLKGGTSIIWHRLSLAGSSSTAPLGVWNEGRGGWRCLTRCWVLRARPPHAEVCGAVLVRPGQSTPPWWWWAVVVGPPASCEPPAPSWGWVGAESRWEGRPYVENYTVDASILKSLCIKFLRAHGGCLGTRNRRRT
jgi:hypothetical protein